MALGWRVTRARGMARALMRSCLGKGDPPSVGWGRWLLDIHDLVPQLEEALGFERLREEVGEVLVAADKRNTDLGFFNGLADEEVAPLDVFELAVVLGVVKNKIFLASSPPPRLGTEPHQYRPEGVRLAPTCPDCTG